MEKHLQKTFCVCPSPTDEELRALLGDRAYPAFKAVRDFVRANYALQEAWQYSKSRDAFDCVFSRNDDLFCSAHARQGAFSLFLAFGAAECEAFYNRFSAFSPEVQTLFRAAAIFSGEKWIRAVIADNTALNELIPLLQFKADMMGFSKPQNA